MSGVITANGFWLAGRKRTALHRADIEFPFVSGKLVKQRGRPPYGTNSTAAVGIRGRSRPGPEEPPRERVRGAGNRPKMIPWHIRRWRPRTAAWIRAWRRASRI